MQSFRDQEESVIFRGVVSQPYEEDIHDVLISSWALPVSCEVVQEGLSRPTRRVEDAHEVLVTGDEPPRDF